VSAKTTSSAPAAATSRATASVRAGLDASRERAAERGRQRDGEADPVRAGPLGQARAQGGGVGHRGVLVARGELVGHGKRVVDLVHGRRDGAVVAALVEDEPGVDRAGPAMQGLEDLLRAGHLRHPGGIDEGDGLDPGHLRGREAIAELGADRGGERPGVVLQPVAR
jgi:hypothetical protein